MPPPTDPTPPPQPPDTVQVFCEDWELLENDALHYMNNVWGKGYITDYEQCLFEARRRGRYPVRLAMAMAVGREPGESVPGSDLRTQAMAPFVDDNGPAPQDIFHRNTVGRL